MRSYRTCRTSEEFNSGYANFIDQPVVDRWEKVFRARSQQVLASTPSHTVLTYGAHERQRIDFFPSAAAGPDAPTLIAIHGGLWFLFDRWMMHFLVPAFNAAGVHVACPSYRLAPGYSLSEIVADCQGAVTCLHAEAPKLGLNASRFSVLGHSAAGQLAAIVASADPIRNSRQQATPPLRSWIGVSGFYEIEPFSQTYFQPLVGFSTEDYQRWNPMNCVQPGMAAGLLITGQHESDWLHEMTTAYASVLHEAGCRAEIRDVPGEDHFSVLERIGDASSTLHRAVLALL